MEEDVPYEHVPPADHFGRRLEVRDAIVSIVIDNDGLRRRLLLVLRPGNGGT